MTSFLNFHAFAATRGDGLRPELRALFERVAAAPRSGLTLGNNGMIQSGPDPISAGVAKEQGKVSLLSASFKSPNRRGKPEPGTSARSLKHVT